MTAPLDTAGLGNPLGWIFMNPDTGIEWAEQHPVESGECPDAYDIQPGHAVHLHHHLIAAWEDARAYADAARVQRLAKEAAERALTAKDSELAEARAEIERLKSDREFVVGFNHGWDEAIEQNLRFPTMLRKMWSGQEVQRWIDEEMSRARTVLSREASSNE